MVGKSEITKDSLQMAAESAATHFGRIATILSGAIREVTHEVGEWATDMFEVREAAGKARAAEDPDGFDSDDVEVPPTGATSD